MTRIALLRHGHTAWNREGRIQGAVDRPLDEDARAELAALRPPPPWDSAALWSSPMRRAEETARLVGGRAPRTDARLSEMSWGAWEGLRGVDLRADPDSGFRDIEHWGWDYHAPKGESPAQVLARLRPALKALAEGPDALVVTHIGVMRAILAEAHDWSFRGDPPFRVKRSRLYVVSLTLEGVAHSPEPPVRLTPCA